MRAAIVKCVSFAYVGPSDFGHSLHLELLSLSPIQPQRRLSFLLTQALMLLESTANLNDAMIGLQWFSTCGSRLPLGSPDDLLGVAWEFQKFANKAVKITNCVF